MAGSPGPQGAKGSSGLPGSPGTLGPKVLYYFVLMDEQYYYLANDRNTLGGKEST